MDSTTGRSDAIAAAADYFDSGAFRRDLDRRVGYRTQSQDPSSGPAMLAYLREAIVPDLERMGFTASVVDNPVSPSHPFLIAHRREGNDLPTVLTYGHGDVQLAHAEQWRKDLDPWRLTIDGDRWYGRGSADNKGQHTVNLGALQQVLAVRENRLGFNVTVLIDMGEEVGSPGLTELCDQRADELGADLLIGSDGPRLAADLPTIFLGSRGVSNFRLQYRARAQGHHSGNWGGVLDNPAVVVANAVAALVDQRGRILVDGLRPSAIPEPVRRALTVVSVDSSPDSPAIDPTWGEPDLTPAERLFGWNALEVLAMTAGDPGGPVNAIPAVATAFCQLRFVVGTDPATIEPVLRAHLDAHGFGMVEIEIEHGINATRLDPESPWVRWAVDSLRVSTGREPGLLPNLGGSLPNAAFADVLGLPTVWIPHSYPGCAQHAPDEHLLAPLMRQAVQLMAGLFWDLGELPGGRPACG